MTASQLRSVPPRKITARASQHLVRQSKANPAVNSTAQGSLINTEINAHMSIVRRSLNVACLLERMPRKKRLLRQSSNERGSAMLNFI